MGLHVKRYGNGEKIVFVHGAGGSTTAWYFQKEYLKAFSEVILLDLPGHGGSPGEGCRSIEEYAEHVRAAVIENKLDGCYMAGHSMGGMIAMQLALTYPGLLKGLILTATGARLRVFPQILDGLLKDKGKTVEEIVAFAFSKKAPPAMIKAGLAEMMKASAEALHCDFFSCDHFDVMRRVHEIDLPTLILCGTDDVLSPPKYSEFLAKEIARSHLVLIPGAGHMVMVEKPEETNRAIERFLAHR